MGSDQTTSSGRCALLEAGETSRVARAGGVQPGLQPYGDWQRDLAGEDDQCVTGVDRALAGHVPDYAFEDHVDVYNYFFGEHGLNVHSEYAYLIQPHFAAALAGAMLQEPRAQ